MSFRKKPKRNLHVFTILEVLEKMSFSSGGKPMHYGAIWIQSVKNQKIIK